MNLIRLEVTQQIINHLRLRHKISRANQWLPTEIIPLIDMRQKVFNIQHPFNIVPWTGIDRNTWISIFNDTLHHLLERCTDIQIDHIQTWCHHLLHGFPTETDNSLQNIILFRKLRFIRQFQRVRQFIHRNIVTLLHKMLIQKSCRTHKHSSYRTEYLFQKVNSRCRKTAKSQSLLCRIDFGHDFAEQQQ